MQVYIEYGFDTNEIENLTFGNLYEGTNWHDPVYTLDK